MNPAYYELTFSKGPRADQHYFRVYVELNDGDREVLRRGDSSEVNTRAIVQRAGVLTLLPAGINDDWIRSGRIISRESKVYWDSGIELQLGDDNRKVWIIEDA